MKKDLELPFKYNCSTSENIKQKYNIFYGACRLNENVFKDNRLGTQQDAQELLLITWTSRRAK